MIKKILSSGLFWLVLILILAAILRFWRLGSYPALNADEAAIGYNAYSLIQTGKDEHGNPWPVHFQSFNDYKPGLYFYIVLPFVKVLGLNEWAVRLPGATLGVLSVLVLYLLVKELFNDKKLALISAFFLAISPWHIQFSRGGWEVNIATFFITLGVLFFVKGVKNPKFHNFALCILSFTLSLYAYHAARVVAPLLGLSLIIIYWKDVAGNIKPLLIAGALGLVLLLPLAHDLLSSNTLSRAAGVGLFADQGPINRINEQRGEHGNVDSVLGRLIHNKVVNYGLAFAENWASHYHGLFLFVSGDVIQRNAVPETGEMYLFDMIFVVTGAIFLIRKFGKSGKLMFAWLVVAPVASALTFQSPNALRAQNMVIPLVIISSVGFIATLRWFNGFKNRKLIFAFCLLTFAFIIWQFARYQHMYWIHMSKEYPFSSQYGVRELVNYIIQNEDKYRTIYVTDKYDQPYILFLFYTKYPPQLFQGNHTLTSRDQFGFSTVRDFGKFHFEKLDFDKVLSEKKDILIAAAPDEVPKGANIVERIYGSNGYEYFDIIKN
jgi:4-amino-4-deoxy-L-arabinose transferase-like glycosyltransferase